MLGYRHLMTKNVFIYMTAYNISIFQSYYYDKGLHC